MSYSKSTLSTAAQILEARRNKAQRIQLARHLEVTEKIPVISEYESKLSQTGLDVVKAIGMGSDAKEYIDQLSQLNLSFQETIKNLLKENGYSENYLSRYFMNAIGMSFHSYVIQYRLEQACHMMRNTNEPILRCAMDNGFTSLRSFNRNFKLRYGLTPSAYRERKTMVER